MPKRLNLSSIGFQLDEVMSGTHQFVSKDGSSDARKFDYKVSWGPKNLAQWLDPLGPEFMKQEMNGTVTVEGLCENAPCQGTLELRYLIDKKIQYRFRFQANGKDYEYVGEKVNIRLWNLPFSHTTCFGVITEADTGRLVSRCLSHFRMKTIIPFLCSFRIIGA